MQFLTQRITIRWDATSLMDHFWSLREGHVGGFDRTLVLAARSLFGINRWVSGGTSRRNAGDFRLYAGVIFHALALTR
jgi:hypothetical protein